MPSASPRVGSLESAKTGMKVTRVFLSCRAISLVAGRDTVLRDQFYNGNVRVFHDASAL